MTVASEGSGKGCTFTFTMLAKMPPEERKPAKRRNSQKMVGSRYRSRFSSQISDNSRSSAGHRSVGPSPARSEDHPTSLDSRSVRDLSE